VTRSGKGSRLTNTEVDSNFTNLNTDKIETDAQVRAAVEAASDSNVFTDADHTKLDGIESSADVTDTANVTAAGALMDSELASVAAVKATTGTFLTADQTKLDGIEAGAKADQVGLVKGTDIGAAADLNTYTTDGYFHQNANSSATSGTNYPPARAGMLSVQADGSMVYQKYQTFNGDGTRQRTKYQTTWYAWDKILDTGNSEAFTCCGLLAEN